MGNLHGTTLERAVLVDRDSREGIEAFYNPKEISLDRSAQWKSHGQGGNVLEYTDATPMTLSCELFCDLYESRGNVDPVFVDPLLDLTKPRDMADGGKPRPPLCVFIWGDGFRRFQGVVESVAVKYTKFLPNGTPCRATATIKMREGDRLKKVKNKVKTRRNNPKPKPNNQRGQRDPRHEALARDLE